MAGIIHKERTSKKFASALNKLIDLKSGKVIQNGLSTPQKAALREWRRGYVRDTALPNKFVEDFAKLCSQSIYIWTKAKQENDFDTFLPHLEKVIGMCRKKADLIGYKDHPNDALLDEFEPHMTMKEVKNLFTPLQKSLTGLLKKIQSNKRPRTRKTLKPLMPSVLGF